MSALAYNDGVGVETPSDRYAVPRATIYIWLDCFEEILIDEATEDEAHPGPPPVLPDYERQQLQRCVTVAESIRLLDKLVVGRRDPETCSE